jgi:pimeloyl-ACP methyl ester carboxylesterase
VRRVERFVKVAGTRLHFVSQGSGRPLVLLHGSPGSMQDFPASLLARLSARYRVIMVDRPGYGQSDGPRQETASAEAQARLLHDALAQIGAAKPLLVGHSWGGLLALAYALQYPNEVAGLVLLAPVAYPEAEPFTFERTLIKTPVLGRVLMWLGKPLIEMEIEDGLKKAFGPCLAPKPYLQSALKEWSKPERVMAFTLDVETTNASLKALSSRYRTLRVPVTILAGEADAEVNPKAHAVPLSRAVPQSKLMLLPGTGHQIQFCRPDAVESAINAFPPQP